jgi:TatD DNase family protein
MHLPVVIHNRDATADLIGILANWKDSLVNSGSPLAKAPGVVHSYSSDLNSALKLVSLGFFIGFTGPITYPKADELRQVARSLPLDCILTETDAPFLAPQPKRGARNEPAFVRFVAEKLADSRGITIHALTEAVKVNANKLFQW